MPAPPEHLSEFEIVQNSGLGAYLLWHFGGAYQGEVPKAPSLLLYFLVLPLVFHAPTARIVASTQKASGLLIFAAKLGDEKEALLAVHQRALVLRSLTTASLATGVETGLLSIDYGAAEVRANALPPKMRKPPNPTGKTKELIGAAAKIGAWFARHEIEHVARVLKVDF